MIGCSGPRTVPFDTSLDRMEMVERYWYFQEHQPVARVMTVVGDPAWLVTRFGDVKALLGDRRLGRSHPDPDHAPRWLPSPLGGGPVLDFATEMADRSAIRKVLAGPFSPNRLAALRPLAEATAAALLDTITAEATPANCFSSFAAPLPRQVTSVHLGIGPDEAEKFMASAAVLIDLRRYDAEQTKVATEALAEYVRKLVAVKRADPGDDVLTEVIRARDVHGQLNEDQVLFVTLIMLLAANGSTTVRICLAVALLLAHPEQYAAMVADPGLVPSAVDEILRVSAGLFDSNLRYARTDVEIHDVAIRAGDLVLLDLCAAHCDRRVFSDPLRFDITRNPNRHMMFGHGFARCIGAAIARMNLEAAVGALARRCATLPFGPLFPMPDRPLAPL